MQEISSKGETIDGKLKDKAPYKPQGAKKTTEVEHFKTQVPTFVNTDQLTKDLQNSGVVLNAKAPDSGRNPLLTLILAFGPTILIIGGLIWLMRRAASMGGAGGLGAFSRSRARLAEPGQMRVTFADVAGIDEAEDELHEIVDFLKRPERYARLGARIPRGVMLYGSPGTGKTLLARAVAGEANVPFFSSSASEFVEAIVGVGASRVRDLFKQAKEAGPAIIFIDELDAIGRARGPAAGFGGNDEREQTLNQILTEMDGFEGDSGVIVIAATNRPDALDPALLRPGRFDRRIAVMAPDKVGREAILRIHSRGMPLGDEVDLGRIAASTPGMTGADLALLVNEAALFAARREHASIEQRDFTDSIEKIVLGTERQVVMSKADRERTAYHEAGHALVGHAHRRRRPRAQGLDHPARAGARRDAVHARGRQVRLRALGAPGPDPRDARRPRRREGRSTARRRPAPSPTSSSSPGSRAAWSARWGMSDAIGAVAVAPAENVGPAAPGASETSEHTQRLIDEEVRQIVDEAEQQTIALLERERDRLESLARALLEHETLDQDEAYEAAGVDAAPVPAPLT